MSKKITIYKDVAAMEAASIEESMKATPEERVLRTVALIKRIYNVKDGPAVYNLPKRITIKKV